MRYGLFGYLLLLLVVVFFLVIYLANMYTKKPTASFSSSKAGQVFNDGNVEFKVPEGYVIDGGEIKRNYDIKDNKGNHIRIRINIPIDEDPYRVVRQNNATQINKNTYTYEDSAIKSYVVILNDFSYIEIYTDKYSPQALTDLDTIFKSFVYRGVIN